MITVLIADDHRMFRQGLRKLFEMEPDIRVVGEAENGLEAHRLAITLDPDVVLMDINMPGIDGVAATRRILAQQPGTSIIILTMFREDEHVFEAIRAGAHGYVLKDADSTELVKALRAVSKGEAVLDPSVTAKVFDRFNSLADMSEKANHEGLTERELRILSLIAEGASNREIGAKLFLSEKTIKNYITSIFQKLQMSDRTQAAVYAIEHGLIDRNTESPPSQET